MKVKYKWLMGGTCLVVGSVSAYLGHGHFAPEPAPTPAVSVYAPLTPEPMALEEKIAEPRINLQTAITFRQFDQTTGERTSRESPAPSFMIGQTAADLQGAFHQWEVLSFSETAVVMERTIASLPAVLYTIGEADGQVVVYQGVQSTGKVWLETGTDLGRFPLEDQQKILQGIPIFSEDELIRRLEDFMN